MVLLIICLNDADYIETIQAICPLCSTITNEIEYLDYIVHNIYITCKNHGKILLCSSDIDMLNEGCSIKLLEDEAKDIIVKHNIMTDNCNYAVYKCGYLNISEITSSKEFSEEDKYKDVFKCGTEFLKKYYHKVDAKCFNEIDEKYCELDNSFVYYNGKCVQCNKNYESHIWSD